MGIRALAVAFTMGVLLNAACSDDTKPPKEAGAPDVRIDQKVSDIGSKVEAGRTDAKADAALAQYSGLLALAEIEGKVPPTNAVMKMLVTSVMEFNVYTDKAKPDFIDSPTPPNCYAYKWKPGGSRNRTTGDAGKITIKGHLTPSYVDGLAATPNPKPVPATIECNRVNAAGSTTLYRYDCGLPDVTVIPTGNVLDDTVAIDYNVAGGKDIPAITTLKGLKATPQVKAKSTFDMAKVDPSASVTAEWETTTAQIVVIRLVAYLNDFSEFAEITCSQLGALGSKAIPPAALALLPKPTATNPVTIQTALAGYTFSSGGGAWGSYLAGVGRGTFGITCRLASGLCP